MVGLATPGAQGSIGYATAVRLAGIGYATGRAVFHRLCYYLRGWKQDRIYPDFLAMANDTDGAQRILMIETKGEHLRGNDDTEYKKRVMKVLQDAYNHQGGTITIEDGPAKGTFRLIFSEAEFATALAH